MIKPNVGIIGYGIVGKSVELGFSRHCNIFIHDINPELNRNPLSEVVMGCDFIFVSIPTPFSLKDNITKTDCIDKVMIEINLIAKNREINPIIIVKSAIVPRVVKYWVRNLKNIELVISPEYLAEKTHYHDFVNQKVMILGGNKLICEQVVKLFNQFSICNKTCKIGICRAEEAALIKYMENSFLGLKNIFNNQFKKYYDKFFGCEGDHQGFNNLMDVFYLDERMGISPTKYRVPGHDGDIGYGGKCIPKDIKTIIQEAKSISADLTLMENVDQINESIRTKKDWLEIKGAIE